MHVVTLDGCGASMMASEGRMGHVLQQLGLKAATMLALGALTLGCARMVTIDYEPTNPWKGKGTLTVLPFRYEAADARRVRPREVESNRAARTELFLSQEVSSFFTDALRRELVHTGYRIGESSPLTVSGSITRFYVDWTNDADRWFELQATYLVQSGERTALTWNCSSLQKGPNTLAQDSLLIRRGTADCMRRFIQASQEAGVLEMESAVPDKMVTPPEVYGPQ